MLLGQQRTQRPGFGDFVIGERRQDAGQALRQHGFAGAGRAAHQDAVAAGSGDFKCEPRGVLAFYVLQVGIGRFFGSISTGLAAGQGSGAGQRCR